MIDKVWDYINQPASNSLLHYNDGSYIFDIPSFNKGAIREAILNACCHRSMLIQSDVVIKQYPDSITITNAGGFPSGVDMNNILTVNSVPRSKLMSEILQKTGLVERSGQGMNLMFELSVQEAKPLPDFTGTDDFFVSVTLNGLIILLTITKKSNNLIEPAVSSAVAYGRCITSNGLVLSCSDNEALPKGEI